MGESDELREARSMRRKILGDEYVDGMTVDPDPVAAELQDYVTSMAWGVWARDGALSVRDRSLLVLAMTAALGRMEEFRLHASCTAQTGVTDDELDELQFQSLPIAVRRPEWQPGAPFGPFAPSGKGVTGDDRDEAIAFGQTLGLDMGTMLQVLNHSSGRSSATTDKFPHHVLTGRYASGFTNELMTKDVDLYLSAVEDLGGGPSSIGTVTASVWKRFATAEPGADFTRIFPSSRVQDVLVLTIKTSLWIE